jgi:ketosteroid isomerase-like protein
MSDLIAKAKTFYSEVMTTPAASCEKYLSADFVLENYLPEYFPFGGRYEGAAGFLQYLGEIAASIEMGPLEMDEWVSDGNVVVARGTEESLVKSTGRKYSMIFVHWLTFNEAGQITNMREYNDTAEMDKGFDHE